MAKLGPHEIEQCAEILLNAELKREPIAPLIESYPALDLDAAYSIQKLGVSLRLERNRSDLVAGFKMGLTSQAKMNQMGLKEPIFGRLLGSRERRAGEPYFRSHWIHPKAEPEIGLRLGREITRPLSAKEALEHCDAACAALEILDSRYRGFKYFSLPDVVADNASAAEFLWGDWVSISNLEGRLTDRKVEFKMAGAVRETGNTNDVLGDPAEALAWLTRLASQHQLKLPAGTVILTGSITAAHALESEQTTEVWIEGFPALRLETTH
jgi:2-oxo-3-hexenedioate decarboxylase